MNPVPHPYPGRALPRARLSVLLGSTAFILAPLVHAQTNGTWNTATSGLLWSSESNWVGNAIADGGGTADFSQVDISGGTTVNLDSSRSIDTLIFGDNNTSTAGNWTLANNGNSSNILTLVGNSAITVNAMASASPTSPNVTISAVISGSGGLVKNGTGANGTFTTSSVSSTGILTLSAANTYTGGTDIQTGAIRAANGSAFGGVSGGAVTVETGASLILSASIANAIYLNGANALAVAGGGSTYTLSGAVSLQSNSSIWVTNVGGNNALIFSSAGSLSLGNNTLTISTGGSANTVAISGTLTGNAASGITFAGGGPLTMSGSNSGYAGTTTLSGSSVLQVGSDTALGTGMLVIEPPNNGNLTIRSNSTVDHTISNAVSLPSSTNYGNASGGFVFGSSSASVNGNLTFTSTADISLGSAGRTFRVYNRTEFDAGFTGNGVGITMATGTGTLVLAGTNTYTGATTISSGTMLVNGSLSTSSAVSVASGARIGGTGSVGAVTFNSGAGLVYELASASQSTGLTTASFSGTGLGGFTVYLTGAGAGFNAAQNYSWKVLTSDATDIGSITMSNVSLDTTGFGQSYTGTFSLSNDGTSIYVDYTAGAIPEPATYALMAGAGLFAFAFWRRRRARA